MIVYINRLKADQRGSYPFELCEEIKPFEYNGESITFTGPVMVKGEISEHQGYYMVTGEIKGEIVLRCSRCLNEFMHNLGTTFRRKYSELAGREDQEEVLPMKGDRIDLAEPVMESIMLELPIKGLCRQDCKGICPVCGNNRNEHQCDCTTDDIDPRLAGLKALLEEQAE